MANRHKGEVTFEVEGESYTLRFSANALCELEDQLDRNINMIAAELADGQRVRLKTVRAVIWAGLREHHPDLSLLDAGEIVVALTVQGAMTLIGQAFERAFPTREAGTENPPAPGKPQETAGPAGTGSLS